MAYLASSICVTRLVASNVLNGSLAKLLFQLEREERTRALQQVDVVSHWQGDFINGYCLAFKV